MEKEALQEYDLLVVDAFSSGSIPVHLLTKEAFDLYFRHLKGDGVLALHISNGYLNLSPVVSALARASGKESAFIYSPPDDANGIYGAEWMLVADGRGILDHPVLRGRVQPAPAGGGLRLWTDDYSNLLQILR
jgi:hypothetical protein